jgi:hypothetical protein
MGNFRSSRSSKIKKQRRKYIAPCYGSTAPIQEGWSSLHRLFAAPRTSRGHAATETEGDSPVFGVDGLPAGPKKVAEPLMLRKLASERSKSLPAPVEGVGGTARNTVPVSRSKASESAIRPAPPRRVGAQAERHMEAAVKSYFTEGETWPAVLLLDRTTGLPPRYTLRKMSLSSSSPVESNL